MSVETASLRIVFAYRYGLLGGVSAQLLNRYPWFSREYDIHILYEHDHGMVRHFPPGVARVTPTPAEMEAAIESLDPDVLLVIDSPAFLDAWAGAGKLGRLILEVHTTTANRGYLKDIREETEIAGFLTVSEYMRTTMVEAGMDRLGPISIVPNCLDSRWFHAPDVDELDERPLMWVGKIDSHKRWRSATDVMDDVLSVLDAEDVRPVFVGGYTAPTASMQAFLRRIHSSTSLKDSCWWPYVSYDRMPGLYRSVAVSEGGLLMTTRNESFGMAAAEAVLMRCPVIAPRVGALPEILPDEALYDPEDWEEVRSKIGRMLSDAGWREQLTEETYDQVAETVHPRHALEAFSDAIDFIV
jgi:glycosyltransferase involved in cell wall biosynthesis